MLSREVAAQRLQAFRVKNWEEERLALLSGLSAKAAAIGRALLGRDAQGKPVSDWQQRQKMETEARDLLGVLPARDRQKLFAALFPRLAEYLEGGWQLFARLPYQLGSARKAFRAPGDPSAGLPVRYAWLSSVVRKLTGYDPDVAWCAAWAPYLSGYGADALGILLAAAIDAGGAEGDAVFEVLLESGRNEHEIGGMGRHVTRALLVASRPEGWEFIEKMLLAAQRQEGLRQVILESIDEAHPEAFRRMVRLILEHDLLRFSAVIRAADVWFGLGWDAVSTGVVKSALERVLRFLEDPAAREEALTRGDAESLYLALWAIAFEDAGAAVAPAARVRGDADVARRYAAVCLLTRLQLSAARAELPAFLEDDDLRVALLALNGCSGDDPALYEPLEKLLARMPGKPRELPALVWPWATTMARSQFVADRLVKHLGQRPPTVLIPYLPAMGWHGRSETVARLVAQKKWDPATRDTLFALVGDKDSTVRRRALEGLKDCQVNEAEAQRLEGLLTRKAGDLRRAVLTLLRSQKDTSALASADRLLAARKPGLRLGGLELLRQLVESKRVVEECRERVARYQEQHSQLTDEELVPIEVVRDVGRVVPTLDNALGLMDPAQQTPRVLPRSRKVAFLTPATLACLKSLDDLIEQHRETMVKLPSHHGVREMLLGNLQYYQFPAVNLKEPLKKDVERLPLRSLWEEWLEQRPKKQRDRDGMELLRASVWCHVTEEGWAHLLKNQGEEWGAFLGLTANGLQPVKLKRSGLVDRILPWLLRLHPPAGAIDYLLDVLETTFASVPEEVRSRVVNMDGSWQERQKDWRNTSPAATWMGEVRSLLALWEGAWRPEQKVRYWQLLHWRDLPAPGVARLRPDLALLLEARQAGAASEADLYDQLLGPGQGFGDLSRLTARQPAPELTTYPWLREIVERCRARVMEVELARGENPTAASRPARALRSLDGLDLLLKTLRALGDRPFARHRSGVSRAEVMTYLITITYPAPGDTREAFAARMKEAKVRPARLLDLAFLAPQWLSHIEHTLSWVGVQEGVWWFLAHMGTGWTGALAVDDPRVDDAKLRERWERLLRERTALTAAERSEGIVDVEWFRRVYEPLGRKRWEALAEAAKFASAYGNSHKKARYLADVMLGRIKKSELVGRLRQKKAREAVRLLGLLPLARGERREADLLSRYRALRDYRRYVRQLSPMSKEGALRDYAIGLANLAHTAGYPDPLRLEWALEAREVADLAAGPVSVTHQGVTVTLALDPQSQADLTARRGDKPLKAIPAPVRKHPKVAALSDRKADLKRQGSRMRESLEAAMCRGDVFTGAELKQLIAHPLLRPLLERLVLVGEGIMGFPVAEGKGLSNHAGKVEPIKPDEALRIAHPHDLLAGGEWDRWQHHCFEAERVQPFKQVFRELYVVTEQEKADGAVSHRYAGQQVNPAQAMALFGHRGWGTRDGVSRTFHEAGLTASVSFRSGAWTPLEVEGLTLEGVEFTRRGEWKPLPLVEVPPRLFSEVMRDLDLVVSVAHVGGVDPEASASTVEMRAALLRETCSLLKIDNYRLKGNHVLIDGRLGSYSIHLGSGVVHRMPGGALCIVPVHAQHRGRLFLPFADDDPRTAEVLSKVILLARDQEIQDPSILEQLR